MHPESRSPAAEESLAAAESSDEAMFTRRGCCCFWVPWSDRRPTSSLEGWERIRAGERPDSDRRPRSDDDLWGRGLRALMKIREWSEIVAGPRWKTFIRRFKRNPRHGGGRSKFGYDPMSYALNFDEGRGNDDSPEIAAGGGFRDFSTRYAAIPSSAKSSMDLGGHDAPAIFDR